jgi:hypothetical protein
MDAFYGIGAYASTLLIMKPLVHGLQVVAEPDAAHAGG